MATEIVVAIIGIVAIVVTASMDMIKTYVKKLIDKKSDKPSVAELVDLDYKIHQHLQTVLSNTNAVRVTICRLHNGGSFTGGIPMQKFTMTHEVVDEFVVGELIQQSFQNILLSSFTVTFMKLFHTKALSVEDIELLQDLNFKKTMEKHDIGSLHMSMICDLETQKPLAFLSVFYGEKHEDIESIVSNEEIELLKQKISVLLTLSFQKYEDEGN